jgi:hypothetical protein
MERMAETSNVGVIRERAQAAADTLSRQVEQRPFALLALSVALGFAAERIVFHRRHDGELEANESPRRRRRKPFRSARARVEARHEEAQQDTGAGGFMKEIASHGQAAAGALAREVVSRLLHRR